MDSLTHVDLLVSSRVCNDHTIVTSTDATTKTFSDPTNILHLFIATLLDILELHLVASVYDFSLFCYLLYISLSLLNPHSFIAAVTQFGPKEPLKFHLFISNLKSAVNIV